LGEWLGVGIAIVSSCLGGTAAAATHHLVGNADPLTLAILRWGIGLVAVFAGIWIATTDTAKVRQGSMS
jgi:hypothetical protein